MKEQKALSHRRGAILRIIVDDYIATASPIGSEHVARGHSLGVSSATVRNDMAALEDEGYITHLHTSAGRFPSDKGYRYFVQDLLRDESLTPEEQLFIQSHFARWQGELESWSRIAAELLSSLVHALALTTIPRAPAARFKHLELIALQEFLVLMVMVLQEAKVKQQVLRVEVDMSQDELTALAQRLNHAYNGLNVQQIAPLGLGGTSSLEAQVSRSITQLMEAEELPGPDVLQLEGLRNLLAQPEFTSTQRVRNLIDVVEERQMLGSLLSQIAVTPGVNVVIGRENPAEELQDLSLVVASYGAPGTLSGTIGLIGPTRLQYGKAIAAVRYLSDLMGDYLTRK